MSDDAELLRAYLDGSEAAFSELVRRHISLVHSTALRLVNNDLHLAQDVTQRVFSDLARKASTVVRRVCKRREALPGWLYTSTRFAAATAVRANQRRKKYEEKALAMSETMSTAEENNGDWETVRPALDDAMNQLSVNDRDAVILRFFQNEELKSIGDVLGLTEDAARMRINRALEKLRGLLAARGVSISAAALVTLLCANAVQAIPPGLAVTVAAATGATATTGIVLLGFMTTKLKIAAVTALIVAGAGTPLVLQQRALIKLQHENAALNAQGQQVLQLQTENERLADMVSRSKGTSSTSQSEFLELMRLRGEVGLLRKDSQELARLRSKDTAPGKSGSDRRVAEETNVLRAESWANVGMDSPDAALQTFFWAARHKDADLVGNLIRWKKDATVPDFDGLDKLVTSLIPGTIQFVSELESMTFLTTNTAEDGIARIQVELASPDGKAPTKQEVAFVQEDGLWKPVFHVFSPRQGSIQGSLAMPKSAEKAL
jgi:RNA polymerase sigma factor (sigma-70 family)